MLPRTNENVPFVPPLLGESEGSFVERTCWFLDSIVRKKKWWENGSVLSVSICFEYVASQLPRSIESLFDNRINASRFIAFYCDFHAGCRVNTRDPFVPFAPPYGRPSLVSDSRESVSSRSSRDSVSSAERMAGGQEMGRCEKKEERKRRSWWFPLPYATTSASSPRFSRATLVRVSYYLTLPYGFPLNRECCSLNFIKAVSPSFESCQCCIVESHSSFAVLPSPSVDSARISRSAKSFLHFVPWIY